MYVKEVISHLNIKNKSKVEPQSIASSGFVSLLLIRDLKDYYMFGFELYPMLLHFKNILI